MRVSFNNSTHGGMQETIPVCKFEFYVTMPEAIETQEEAARWILCQLGEMLDDFKRSLPGAEIWVNEKLLPREAEKGGGKA